MVLAINKRFAVPVKQSEVPLILRLSNDVLTDILRLAVDTTPVLEGHQSTRSAFLLHDTLIEERLRMI